MAAGGVGGLLTVRVTQGTTTAADDRTYAYLYNGNGNVTHLIDVTLIPDGEPDEGEPAEGFGAIAAYYEHDAWGRTVSAQGPMANKQPFRFSTKQYDADTGLYYYGYRFYSPRLGRWINRDPLGEAGGVNLYGFVGNSPEDGVDPLGLQSRTEFMLDRIYSNPITAAEHNRQMAPLVAVSLDIAGEGLKGGGRFLKKVGQGAVELPLAAIDVVNLAQDTLTADEGDDATHHVMLSQFGRACTSYTPANDPIQSAQDTAVNMVTLGGAGLVGAAQASWAAGDAGALIDYMGNWVGGAFAGAGLTKFATGGGLPKGAVASDAALAEATQQGGTATPKTAAASAQIAQQPSPTST